MTKQPCTHCHGSGRIYSPPVRHTCPICRGTGKV